MTLLDATPYDSAKARRRRIKIALGLMAILILAALAWSYRNWPEERIIDNFFAALQRQDFETAYGVYFHDPEWRQHPQNYKQYSYSDFYRDWGPGGEWGLVKSHKIYASASTKGSNGGGVVVEVVVNDRAEHARMFVQKADRTITMYPF